MPTDTPRPKRSFYRRWFRRLSIAAGFGIIGIPLATLRDVDRTPWSETKAANDALAIAADMHRELASAESAPLHAGWASDPLPTTVGQPLAGYGARGNDVATALGEPLFARALYVRSAKAELIFLTADILVVSPLVAKLTVERCRAAGLPDESIFFTATHTHCGPGGWAPGVIEQFICGDFDQKHAVGLAESMATAAIAARKNATASEWTWLKTESPDHVRNRTLIGGATDPTLEALAIRKLGSPNKPTGVFTFYGAHATCFGHRQLAFNADYPGHLVRTLESHGITFAAFAAGCVGSQSPSGKGNSAERAKHIGTSLAASLLDQLPSAEWSSEAALGTSRRTIPTLPLQIRVNNTTRLADWVTASVHAPETPFHIVRLDSQWVAGISAEFSAMLSRPLRSEAQSAGIGLAITPFNGAYIGYVLPADLYDSGAYEAQLNFQGPGGGDFFTALIRAGTGLPEIHYP